MLSKIIFMFSLKKKKLDNKIKFIPIEAYSQFKFF